MITPTKAEINGGWNATINGKTATDGVYYYIYKGVKMGGSTINGEGYLQLLSKNKTLTTGVMPGGAMPDLEESINEIEIYYRQQKRQLFFEKFSYVCLSIAAVGYSHYYMVVYAATHKAHITDSQIEIADVVVIIMVFSCFLFSPLYKFISDKIVKKMNWDIKTSIFKTVLSTYTHDYHFTFEGELPDEDITNLDFEKGLFDFCSEKEFIFGKLNSKPFRISVVNKVSLFSSRFNGIIAVIETGKLITDAQHGTIKEIILKYKNMKLLNVVKNKIYIGSDGKKKYFEFEIINGRVNREDLTDDFMRFKTVVEALNDLSKQPLLAAVIS